MQHTVPLNDTEDDTEIDIWDLKQYEYKIVTP